MQNYSQSKNSDWHVNFMRVILSALFLILSARCFELQVIKGNYYRDLANGNKTREIIIPAQRGKILARSGEVLVGNKQKTVGFIFDENVGYVITENTDTLEDHSKFQLPIRHYDFGESFAHVSGFLGETNEDEVGKIQALCPEKGDLGLTEMVGKSGLEKEYNCVLRGINGKRLIEVDANGNLVRVLGEQKAQIGEDLKTTINYNLQKETLKFLDGKKAAVVVSDTSGQILALVSSPSFDPNKLTNGNERAYIERIFSDTDLPMFDRAISGTYAPGSVFKPIVAVSALLSGAIGPDFVFNDEGFIEIKTVYGNFRYNNWYYTQYGGREGEIGLDRAIARSTDTFFYKIGELTGIETIVDWAKKFGLDDKTNIDLPGETEGLVPSPLWKEKVKAEKWFLGNTYHVSIGQGDLLLTPIALNQAMAAIASNGILCKPHITGQNECRRIFDNDVSLVVEGMEKACQMGGTGYTFFDAPVPIACKTGTAETFENKDPHAWFTFFAPVEDPQIVVSIVVENGGEGSKVAGPIAREIYDLYFGINTEKPHEDTL